MLVSRENTILCYTKVDSAEGEVASGSTLKVDSAEGEVASGSTLLSDFPHYKFRFNFTYSLMQIVQLNNSVVGQMIPVGQRSFLVPTVWHPHSLSALLTLSLGCLAHHLKTLNKKCDCKSDKCTLLREL
jgi:hypothetical protein